MPSTNHLSLFTIGLLKSAILNEDSAIEKSAILISMVGKEIDRCKVNNQPTDELEYLYDTAIWLKSEVL